MKTIIQTQQTLISEIFSSLQGEGPRMGERHLFIRFAGCPLSCRYCDEALKEGRLKSVEDVLFEVDCLEKQHGPHACVSLTGGEPLMAVSFLKGFLPQLKGRGFKVLLETAGVHSEALEEVIGWCDVISMDFKLPSVTGERNFEEEHKKFLLLARVKEVYVKTVISDQISWVEFDRHVKILRDTAPEIPFVLQPMTDREGRMAKGLMEIMFRLARLASQHLSKVQILPRLQTLLQIP